jgi:hypothetical protein
VKTVPFTSIRNDTTIAPATSSVLMGIAYRYLRPDDIIVTLFDA